MCLTLSPRPAGKAVERPCTTAICVADRTFLEPTGGPIPCQTHRQHLQTRIIFPCPGLSAWLTPVASCLKASSQPPSDFSCSFTTTRYSGSGRAWRASPSSLPSAWTRSVIQSSVHGRMQHVVDSGAGMATCMRLPCPLPCCSWPYSCLRPGSATPGCFCGCWSLPR